MCFFEKRINDISNDPKDIELATIGRELNQLNKMGTHRRRGRKRGSFPKVYYEKNDGYNII